jgi:multidrug efflux pump subunit AcrA (membrane-fusion protein)
MNTTPHPRQASPIELPPQDEGGLRPPPGLSFWRRVWWWFDFLILVKLARLRFVAILIVIGLVITKWDLLIAYYEKWTRPASAASTAGGSDYEWFCPMHPSVVRDNSKEKCPICFMPLSKRTKGKDGEPDPLPAGIVSRVQLTPYRIVLAGVGTWRVDYMPLSREIVTTGQVEFNERGQKTVSARVAGRIDKLLASETGRMVNQGDVLAEIYSPDLFVTVQNLLQAQKSGNQSLVRDAQTRLELLGIDKMQIDEILQTGKAATHLKIRSPIQGHVIQKYVREGQYVEEGMALYDIADLRTVWIQAQVYEDDIALLPLSQETPLMADGSGLPVVATMRAFPGEEFHGTLQFTYPHVDQATRTLSVRFEIENPHPHKLRPGSTATVRLFVAPQHVESLAAAGMTDSQKEDLSTGRVLAVPAGAVIDTGDQKIVYRRSSPSEFEGVRVTLGPKMTDPDGVVFLPVLSGLAAGDQIVTSGSFLVDAETRLNPAAGSIYFGGSSGAKSATGGSTVRATTPEDPDAKIVAALDKLSPGDRKLAEQQRTCPVLASSRLGSMGPPVKLALEGETVFLCCSGCTAKAKADPAATVKRVKELRSQPADAPPANQPPPPKNDLFAQSDVSPEASVKEIGEALARLSPADRQLAIAQQFCAVSNTSRLGSMGPPVKVMVKGEPIFLCCDGCEQSAKEDPEGMLRRAKELRAKSQPTADGSSPKSTTAPAFVEEKPPASADEKKYEAAIARLPAADRPLATSQKFCAVLAESRLGSMGPPAKIVLNGEPVFLCCKGCEQAAKANPQAAVARARQLRAESQSKQSATSAEGARR